MSLFAVFIVCFLVWGILLGIPFFIAKKVAVRPSLQEASKKVILPPQAHIQTVFFYGIILFVVTGVYTSFATTKNLLAFKVFSIIILVSFTYKTLNFFRKRG